METRQPEQTQDADTRLRVREAIKQRWGRITDEDLDKVEEKLDWLTGLVQEKYNYSLEQAAHEVDRFRGEYGEKFQEVKDSAVSSAQAARKSAVTSAEQTVAEYPWQVVLAALALGFVLGLLLSPGDKKVEED
jgi:ElaB/YqjD/DUF883 family membrane-anchored ribosome-binding protein